MLVSSSDTKGKGTAIDSKLTVGSNGIRNQILLFNLDYLYLYGEENTADFVFLAKSFCHWDLLLFALKKIIKCSICQAIISIYQ
jgi:hypothetical protein